MNCPTTNRITYKLNIEELLAVKEKLLMKYLAYILLTFMLCLSTFQAVSARTHKIYIDPGHYVGDKRTVTEIETNLAVAQKLYKLLENDTSSGVRWEILMSRYGPDSRTSNPKPRLDLDTPTHRAIDANDFKAELFLSIHCNADGPGATGTETFWCGHYTEYPNPPIPKDAIMPDESADRSERFANLVQKHMTKRGEWISRHNGSGQLDHDYDHFQNKYTAFNGHLPILLYLKVPGCLNEIGFVTNSADKTKLESDYWRNKFAEAYRDAIYEYFNLQLPNYLEITLEDGWNAISIPGIPVSSYPWSTIIRSDLLQTPMLKRWDPVDEKAKNVRRIKFGEAYWIHSDGGGKEKVHISYFPRDEYTIRLERKYNMVGSVSHTADFRDAMNGSISQTLWTWDPSSNKLQKVPSGTIRTGKGYFVFARRRTELTIRSDVQAAPTHMPENIPGETQVLANFPNPFNPETWIPFHLKETGNVTIFIHTATGHVVRTLRLGPTKPGIYITKDRAAYWDGRNEQGTKVASGVYFYTLQTEHFTHTKKMLLLK